MTASRLAFSLACWVRALSCSIAIRPKCCKATMPNIVEEDASPEPGTKVKGTPCEGRACASAIVAASFVPGASPVETLPNSSHVGCLKRFPPPKLRQHSAEQWRHGPLDHLEIGSPQCLQPTVVSAICVPEALPAVNEVWVMSPLPWQ